MKNDARFVLNPTTIDITRSRFNRSSGLKTSFNAGELIPIYIDEVLPGDTFDMKTHAVVRSSTPIAPVMDDSFLDLYYFFVPHRLVWEHWQEFNGENSSTFWDQKIEYKIPHMLPIEGEGLGGKGSIVSYMMDLAIEQTSLEESYFANNITDLPFRSYALIWNEYFRDQNTQAPFLFSKGDISTVDIAGLPCFPVNKYHDYFTSCLPGPQKGPSVKLPLGDLAPVLTSTTDIVENANTLANIRFKKSADDAYNLAVSDEGEVMQGGILASPPSVSLGSPENLYADLAEASAASINSLRLAFQLQKLLERDARGGTRYIELIASHFGVQSDDARLQRPEYLGGSRERLNVNQVLSTTGIQGEDSEATLGTTGAYGLTGVSGAPFTKSFTEHGYVIGLASVRTSHTYGQGLNRMFTKLSRFDFYWPALANIGEQGTYKYELLASLLNGSENEQVIFGFQEAWAEYRFKQNRVNNYMNPALENSLSYWTYADVFKEADIVLNSDFMKETKANIDRTLAVTSAVTHQYIADIRFDLTCTRPMPLYSIPGLIDHN